VKWISSRSCVDPVLLRGLDLKCLQRAGLLDERRGLRRDLRRRHGDVVVGREPAQHPLADEPGQRHPHEAGLVLAQLCAELRVLQRTSDVRVSEVGVDDVLKRAD